MQAERMHASACAAPGREATLRAPELQNFALFMRQYAEGINAIARAILGSSNLAEEVCVRVFSRAFRRCPCWREPEIEILRLTVAVCRRLRWLCVCTIFGPSSEPETVGLLRGMPWKFRVLLALREVGQLSLEDMAKVLKRSIPSVRAGLVQARLRFNEIHRGSNEKQS